MKRAGSKRPKSGVVKIGRASGRVKCFIRVRPLNDDEIEREDELAVEVSQDKKEVIVNDTRVGLVKNFQFDHVFPPETTNPQISSFISKPLVNAALNGFNGTVMAYGQTGSGKTYTLMSPDGVAATIIEKSFKKMATKENLQYKVSMSYLQIYQEKIYDLLNNATSNKIDLTIREHPQKGVYVENLSEYVVRSPDAVLSLLQLGKKRLIFAETKMNRTSSRSHSVCILSIERSSKNAAQSDSPTTTKKLCNKKLLEVNDILTNSHHSSEPSLYHQESSDDEDEDDALSKMMAFNKDVVLKGHLYICDLAGSERIKKTNAEGERLSEAQHINLSLLELGNVIQALAEGAESGHSGHIPFRNSTLTRLLQESLGGNCKTSLVVCCSPSDLHVHETKCSLNFGSRAMKIKNTAFVNVEMDYKKLSEDLAKLVDAREKQIEDLKVSQQHELDLRRKEAEMAAEMKFGDGLNEARKAYVALKLLMDTQANSHAENMSQLQAELSREKDSNLALQAELSKKSDSSNDQHCKTKCLLLTEVLSMQLFYTLQSSAGKPGQSEMFDQVSRELVKQDVLGTQEDILENVDNLIGVLGTYLNLTEKEFSDAEDEEFYIDEEDDFSSMGDLHGKISGLQSLVIKIRKRLMVLKDSVDGRTLRFLNGIVDRKDRKSMENMKDVYQILQKLLTARNESSDPEFLDNSKDAERCLTYVLLDKALLCCLVVLEKYESERKFLELGSENEALIEELETSRGRNKSFKKDNERLIAQLERRRGERELISDAQADTPSESNRKTIEKLLKHNAKLQLEIEELRKTPGAKRGTSEVSGSDVELFYLRQQVTKLTRENEKLEFMMKAMGERFSQGGSEKPTKDMETGISQNEISLTASREQAKAESPRIDERAMEKMEDKKETGTSTSPSASVGGRSKSTVYTVEDTRIKEQLLTSKIEADKTLKQLIVIKQQINNLDSPNTSVSCDASTEPDPERKKLDRLLDTAIESAQSVGMNTGLILNSSLEDIEALERDVNAMKVNNEALGRQCLSLVSDRQTLEVLLSDLRSNIAGLQENVVTKDTPISSSFPSFIPNFTQSTEENETEVKTEMFTCSTTTESPLKKIQVQKVSTSLDQENKHVEVSLREFTTRDCQTDVTLVPDAENYFSESDGVEEKEGETTSVVVQRLTNKYSLVKQLVKHLEAEIRQFKIRTTALETELKERQHLKDENLLLEEEVKELQGLKIYLESQLAEGGGGETDEAYDSFSRDEEESNLSKWKDFEKRDSFLDFSGSSNFSASTLNLTSTPIYKANYQGMSQSMMDLSQPQMYTSFSSLKSARGSFGSLKMLKLEMEGQPSRIRDKLKSASLLLQHTGSLESQLKSSRQKCFRLEGEVCKLIKEKKELNEELDKMRAKLREETMHDIGFDPVDPVDKPSDESPFGSKTKRRSFRFKRAGKEEKDRLKNELTLAKEQLSKLKSQLVMPSQTVTDSTQKRSPSYMSLSEDEKRREKELALTRERCLILAEELGASNKEKIKLGDDLQEALDNIDVLANEIKRLDLVEEGKRRLEVRLLEMEDKLAKTAEEQSSEKNNEDLDHLKLDIVELLGEKSKLEESVVELRWEKERLNEMESIVQRLMQVEKEKKQVGLTKQGKDGNHEEYQESAELIRLKNENEQLKDELEVLKERVLDLEFELDKSSENTSLTQVLSAVKDKRSKTTRSAQNKVDMGSRGGTMSTKSRSGSDIKLGRGGRSTNDQSKEHKEESRSGSERKSRPKVLVSLFH